MTTVLAIVVAPCPSPSPMTTSILWPTSRGDLDLHTFLGLTDGHAGFSTIQAKVHVESDAGEEAIAAIHEEVDAASPAGHTLVRSIPVEVTLA
jgi:hypothetical protein